MINLILPMAGHGQRFRDAGYKVEKPLIFVKGKTLLQWSLDSLPRDMFRVTAIIRQDQLELINHSLPGIHRTLVIPGSTHGAACTVLAAALGLPQDEPVAAMNCDQIFEADLSGAVAAAKTHPWDGFLLTFPGTGPSWSYAITDGGGHVVHVIEKKQVSPYATVGFYYWSRCSDLVKSICAMIANNQRVKGEFYLAPSYNFLPLDNHHVHIFPVEKFIGLGTPEQVKAFEESA